MNNAGMGLLDPSELGAYDQFMKILKVNDVILHEVKLKKWNLLCKYNEIICKMKKRGKCNVESKKSYVG